MTSSTAVPRWLSIVGIGEDGVDGLSPTARGLIESANVVVGGKRHLALADSIIKQTARRIAWPTPITDGLDEIANERGNRVVVLATGDPFHYGVGTLLAKNFKITEINCIPQASAFALAAAQLGWSLQTTKLISLHGRPLEGLNRHLLPNAKILALTWDATTPSRVADLLTKRGLAKAQLTVLESLGGPSQRIQACEASAFDLRDIDDLNTLAIELPLVENVSIRANTFARLASGLPDEAFEHDGQLTRHDIRTMTLAALDPRPGEHLWDVGLGAGSIAIEWLLTDQTMGATGFERDPVRVARALSNAANLGVPELNVITGDAPATLEHVASRDLPDAVFIGGGLTKKGVFESSWSTLRTGGRLVANAVTLESQARLTDLHARHGGELKKIEIATADGVGRMRGWRPAMPVVQWRVTKP